MKINGNMSLKELSEKCKEHYDCWMCEYSYNKSSSLRCKLIGRPSSWEFSKTYNEDFLEKFPNAKLRNDVTVGVCLVNVYGEQHAPGSDPVYPCRGFTCEECWNRVMPEEE